MANQNFHSKPLIELPEQIVFFAFDFRRIDSVEWTLLDLLKNYQKVLNFGVFHFLASFQGFFGVLRKHNAFRDYFDSQCILSIYPIKFGFNSLKLEFFSHRK